MEDRKLPQNNKGVDLPDFFKGSSLSDEILEDALEDENSTLESNDEPVYFEFEDEYNEYSTARPTFANEQDQEKRFFFLESENEPSNLDETQMKSVFNLVLEDEEEDLREAYLAKQGTPSRSYTDTGSFGSPSIWGSSTMAASPNPANKFTNNWGASRQEATLPITAMPQQLHQPHAENILSKFFGGSIPPGSNLPPTTPQNIAPKAISVEELEARMKSANIVNQPQQVVPQPSPQQIPPMQQPVNHTAAIPQQGPAQIRNKNAQQSAPVSMPQRQHRGYRDERVSTSPRSPSTKSSLTLGQFFPREIASENKSNYQPRESGYHSTQYRPKWKESKKYMNADEIDMIIRMQDSQLHASGNPFAEDYYFLVLTNSIKQEKDAAVINHKPLFEGSPRFIPTRKPGADPFEGVLGRIPTHSVRAPRPLLQLKDVDKSNENNEPSSTSSKAVYSLLLAIENAFNLLLEVEDLDSILKRPESQQHYNIQHLLQKREELTNEFFKLLHVYIPPYGTLPQRQKNESEWLAPYLYPEDELFVYITLIHKGRKLVSRAFAILFQFHLFPMIFAYTRNLAFIVSSTRLEVDIESTNKLFQQICDVINQGAASHIILLLQTILSSHSDAQLPRIFESRLGLSILQTILKKGHDMGLSPFARDEIPVPNDPQSLQNAPPIVSAGYHWKQATNALCSRMQGHFSNLFRYYEKGLVNKLWEFFAVLVININTTEKQKLLVELMPIIQSTPANPTLSAFLQLAGPGVPR